MTSKFGPREVVCLVFLQFNSFVIYLIWTGCSSTHVLYRFRKTFPMSNFTLCIDVDERVTISVILPKRSSSSRSDTSSGGSRARSKISTTILSNLDEETLDVSPLCRVFDSIFDSELNSMFRSLSLQSKPPSIWNVYQTFSPILSRPAGATSNRKFPQPVRSLCRSGYNDPAAGGHHGWGTDHECGEQRGKTRSD